jgi:transposase
VTTPTQRFVGIDVSKDVLDTHLRPDDTARRFDNTPAGTNARPWRRFPSGVFR